MDRTPGDMDRTPGGMDRTLYHVTIAALPIELIFLGWCKMFGNRCVGSLLQHFNKFATNYGHFLYRKGMRIT